MQYKRDNHSYNCLTNEDLTLFHDVKAICATTLKHTIFKWIINIIWGRNNSINICILCALSCQAPFFSNIRKDFFLKILNHTSIKRHSTYKSFNHSDMSGIFSVNLSKMFMNMTVITLAKHPVEASFANPHTSQYVVHGHLRIRFHVKNNSLTNKSNTTTQSWWTITEYIFYFCHDVKKAFSASLSRMFLWKPIYHLAGSTLLWQFSTADEMACLL